MSGIVQSLFGSSSCPARYLLFPRCPEIWSRGIIMASQSTKPHGAERLKALRQHLKLSRAAFGHQLGVTERDIERWEEGNERPSPNSFVQLGNLAGEPSCWDFWRDAGLYSGDFVRALPAVRLHMRRGRPDLEIVHAGGGQHLFSKPQWHAIPLLAVKAATHGHEGDKEFDFDRMPPEGLIAAPSHWAPNPAVTSCLRVRGNSMAPVLCDGYIIVIDTSVNDPERLVGKVVVAWHKENGLTVSWLKTVDGSPTLVSESQQYGSIRLKPHWRVIGKVLWWIGKSE
jgi:hypothetical protein